jgi:competence protein ComEA
VRRKLGKPKVVGVLNVNRASEAELRLLPGIGKLRAAQIVARRAKRPYASLEDLARLRGLRKLVHRLRAHLTVSGDTTLRPAEP